jgi:uncharacterized protein
VRSRPALLVCVAVALAWPLATSAQGFKIPPTPDHFVTDNAGVLSSDTSGSVENELRAYEAATGHQVIVWIGQTTGDVPLETWTSETADHWKVGRRGHDDGAVLFLFTQDHKVRIEVGYGLESSLTDADSHRIISDVIVPRMKAGDPNGAVSSGVAAMLTTITPGYKGVTPPPEAAPSGAGNGVAAFMAFVIGLTFLFLIWMIVMAVVRMIRYGYLIMREGPKAAGKDMKSWPAWAGGAFIAGSSGFGGGGGDFGGGFSSGGGSFGGGGASGGW